MREVEGGGGFMDGGFLGGCQRSHWELQKKKKKWFPSTLIY